MENELYHYGRPHDNAPGRGSGRYAWGSGKNQKNMLSTYRRKDGTYVVGKERRPDMKRVEGTTRILNETGSAVSKTKGVTSGVFGLKRASRQYDLSKMSDEDLRKAVNRMNLEENYRNLKNSDINNGESKVNSWLGIVGGTVGVAASAATIAYVIYKMKSGN